jgi:hypothetical protein
MIHTRVRGARRFALAESRPLQILLGCPISRDRRLCTAHLSFSDKTRTVADFGCLEIERADWNDLTSLDNYCGNLGPSYGGFQNMLPPPRCQ